ncbi:substrate-binding domain-containing protein [Streptomyces sp. NPDC000659]|uniref:LacI family DNA-binding transcriptional regulator n=1 Tax=unclassified Streptomyces TaxID=2593676 RepID=UPI00332A5981
MAAAGAVRHLLGRGRHAIATVTGPLCVYGARCRLDGYREALTEAGLPVDGLLIADGDFTEEGGRRAVRELLEHRPALDAVFAASDVMAVGARRELCAAGRRIPEGVALVGFDDSVLARHMDPPLTSVRQPVGEMGRTMARMLLARMAGEPGEPGEAAVVLPTELVVRESS